MVLAGAAVHGWGMYDKNRLERRTEVSDVTWHVYAYWLCWILLGLGALVLIARSIV